MMKLEFIRTRQGNYVAKNAEITYVIESSGNQYSVDITGIYVAEKFNDIQEAKKFCQKVEDDLFDADMINTAIEIAMKSVGGAKAFYEMVDGKDVKIILNDDGRSSTVWLNFNVRHCFWLTSNAWDKSIVIFLDTNLYCTKINFNNGIKINRLVKPELKQFEPAEQE